MENDNVVDHPRKNNAGRKKISIKAMSLLPPQSVEEQERLKDEKLALEYGQKILTMRKGANFTQAVLAMKIGKDQATIARLENGNGGHLLKTKTLHLIADACGYDLNITPEKIETGHDGFVCSSASFTPLKIRGQQ